MIFPNQLKLEDKGLSAEEVAMLEVILKEMIRKADFRAKILAGNPKKQAERALQVGGAQQLSYVLFTIKEIQLGNLSPAQAQQDAPNDNPEEGKVQP